MKRIKITFITGHLCKERHSLLNDLALDLGKKGAEVTVLTGFPSRRISEATRKYYLDHPVEQISDFVLVKRVGSRRGEGNGLFVRMIKYFFLSRKLYKEAKRIKTDVFFLYSSPFFLGYIGTKLKKIAPTIYNAQDLFPDTLVHQKNWSEGNLLIKYFRKKERNVYKKNTHIITISNQMKRNIVFHGGDENKISVIYNWADNDSLRHVSKEENILFDEYQIRRSRFIVSYAGDLGLFQGWDTILNAAKSINLIDSSILFVLFGSGSYRNKIIERIENEHISNVIVLPLQPFSKLSEVYSFGDVELLPIESGLTKMALPSKSSVIMATGSPLLAIVDEESDIFNAVKNNEIGLSVQPGNERQLIESVIYLKDNPELLKKYGMNARAFATKYLNRDKQTQKYFDVLYSMAKKDEK